LQNHANAHEPYSQLKIQVSKIQDGGWPPVSKTVKSP